MKVICRLICPILFLLMVLSCTDERAINAAFTQGRTSWFRFEGTGVVPVNGFESEPALTWKPRYRAQFVTDASMVPGDGGTAALAVSDLGLVVVSDGDGNLQIQTPSSVLELTAFRTGRLFLYDDKVFLHLYREPGDPNVGVSPPTVSLAWWKPGQNRLAFYPVPSQVSEPTKQAVDLRYQAETVDFLWKSLAGSSWKWTASRLSLGDGKESALSLTVFDRNDPVEAPDVFLPLKDKLSSRLGDDLSGQIDLTLADGGSRRAVWPGKTGPLVTAGAWAGASSILLAENGVAAVSLGDEPRIYRLPDLGAAGRYTRVVSLKQGFLVCWELSWRGYTGPAGLLYIPYALLKS